MEYTIRRFILRAALILVGLVGWAGFAHASFIREAEPGIVELNCDQRDGSLVVEKLHMSRNGKWIYLILREKTGGTQRYFYAPAADFKFKLGQRLRLVQYGLQKRLQNQHGKIPFGQERHFYRLVYFETVS